MDKVQIKALVRSYVAEIIEEAREYYATNPRRRTHDQLEAQLRSYTDVKETLKEALALNDLRKVQPFVDALLADRELALSKDSGDYKRLSHTLLHTLVHLTDIDRGLYLGRVPYTEPPRRRK